MQNKRILFSAIIFMLFFGNSYGDEIIRAGKLFNSEKAIWEKNQVLLIRNGKIVSVNPKVIPSAIKVHDFSSYYIIPGLIDSHTHLFLEELTYGRDFAAGLLAFVKGTSLDKRKALGLKRSETMLKSGFTSVRDLGNDGGLVVAALEDKNTPRLFTSGKGFAPHAGQFPHGVSKEILEDEYVLLKGTPEKGLDNHLKRKIDVVKLYADEDPNPAVTPLPVLKQWVSFSHGKNLKVAVHANFKNAIDSAIESGADTLEHGFEITSEQLKKMSERNMIYVPTNQNILVKNYEKEFKLQGIQEQVARYCENIRNADKSGVEIAFGSDNFFSLEKKGLSFGEATMECLIHYAVCGLSPAKTLKAATFTAARTIGKEHEIGVLKSGAFADFIVLKNDPLKDMHELKKPFKIFKSGNEVGP